MSRLTTSFLIVPQPILTLRIPSLTSRSPAYHCGYLNWVIGYSCSHACVSKHPPADLAIHHNTLRAAKEQPDVTSYIPCILSLACNWSISDTIGDLIRSSLRTVLWPCKRLKSSLLLFFHTITFVGAAMTIHEVLTQVVPLRMKCDLL